MVQKALFSSATAEWATPQEFFERVAKEWGPFDLDVCATAENAKCAKHYNKQENGLLQPWIGICWMNPPYGRDIGFWVAKARRVVHEGSAQRVVCLLPARTDTAWFHDYIYRQAHVVFIRGRLKFGGSKNSAPFPSMLAVFG